MTRWSWARRSTRTTGIPTPATSSPATRRSCGTGRSGSSPADRWTRRRAAEPQVDAAASVDEQERARRVNHAVQRLRPAEREVIVLHYLEGLSVEEVAAIVGNKRGAVEVRLHRARNRLEGMLARMMSDENR